MNRKQLLQRKADLTNEGKAIIDAAHGENRSFNEAERERLKAINNEVEGISSDLEVIEQQAARERQMESLRRFEPEQTATAAPATQRPTKTWGSFGEQLLAVHSASQQGTVVDQRLQAATGLSQGVPAEGGFLVDPAYSNLIWDGLNQAPDNLLAMTDSYTVTGESLTFKANAETSRATGSRWGALRGYWIAEAAQITGSKPKWREVRVEPQQLAVLVYVTDKLLRNAPALEQYVMRAAMSEIQFLVGDAIINGDGAGKPQGILQSPSLISVSKETGQAAATVVAENISKMWARLHPAGRANARWFYNVEIEPQLDQLSFAIGTSGQLVYSQSLTDATPMRIKARPAMPIEYCAALGTVGDLVLADMKAYITGVRGGAAGGVQTAMSMHFKFDTAETAFRIMFEVDGQPWVNSAITPFKGSSTLSPFVALATRA